MQRAVLGEVALEYEDSGASGEPIVFVHGALVADTFRSLMNESSLGRYRLITYHRRGYTGSSSARPPLTLEEQAADCKALLNHLGIERAHVVGHSLGGCIALQLALDAPSSVESLALLEPALIAGSTADSYRTSLVRGIERFHEIDAAVLAHEFLQARWPNYRDALEAVVPGAFAQAVADAATVFEVEVPALVEWRFGEAEARRIKQPLLSVLGGDSDALWARFGEVHHLLLSWMPQAEGFVVPDATHFMQLQEPRLLAERLADFVRRGG